MRRRQTKPRALLVSALACAGALACQPAGEEDGTQLTGLLADKCPYFVEGDVYLGGLFPFTGAWPVGDGLHLGARLAVEEINAGGGIDGRQLGFIACNTESDRLTGVSILEQLAAREDLGAVVGPGRSIVMLGSGADRGTGAVAREMRTVLISPAATSPAISTLDDDGYVFRTTVSDAVQGKVLAELAAGQGFKRVFVMQTDGDAYAIGLANRFIEVFDTSGAGGDRATEREAFNFADTQFAQTLFDKAKAFNADAILLSMLSKEAEAILKVGQTYTWGGAAPAWLAPDGVREQGTLDELLSIVGAGGRVFGTNPGANAGPRYVGFRDRHRARFGSEPSLYAEHTYDAAYLLAGAMVLAQNPADGSELKLALWKTQPGPGVAQFSPNDWPRFMEALKTAGQADYEGASGNVDFDANGDVYSNIEQWEIDLATGQFKTVACWTADGTRCAN